MNAKQTLSASLVGLVCVASPALGDDGDEPTGEVQPKLGMRKPTGTFEIGAGYATDDGVGFHARIAQPSLFGSDKGLALSASLTERWQELLVRYEDPTLLDTDVRLRGDLYHRSKQYTGFRREGIGGELQLTRRVAPNLDLFGGYRLEHVTVIGDDDVSARAVGEIPGRGDYVLGAMRVGMQYRSMPEVDSPRRGTIAGASLEYADEQLGSDVSYLRVDTWLGRHQPIGPFTLHVGGSLRGYLTRDLPIAERLHFDGSADVRGYAPGSILPGGGHFMWTAKTELETPSWHGLSVAGFLDAGGLYTHGAGGEAASVGFGVIWRSPIGPLRFDWAKPLTGEDRDLRFIFGIGGAF